MAGALRNLSKAAFEAAGGMRYMSTGAGEGFKAAVLGAAGGIGQPLSLLMKVNSRVNAQHNIPMWFPCCSVTVDANARLPLAL